MNYRLTIYLIASVIKVEGILMLPSALISLCCGEHKSALSFFIAMAFMFAVGFPLSWRRPKNRSMNIRQGFVIVALSWIAMALFGAIPFYASGSIPGIIDSIFESVSGFTTTGSTILTNVEILPKGILFWRSFTHWLGGMGVLVFILAIDNIAGGSLNLLRAESTGPSPGKLVPKMRRTALILYGIYMGLTVLETLFLSLGGMPLFDSLATTFGTVGTGGFGIKNASIAYYDNVYFEVVITIFLIISGINFSALYLIVLRRLKEFWKNEEVRIYLGIIAASILMITVNLTLQTYDTIARALRYSSFQVASIITTAGFATAPFESWPVFSQFILMILMILGACAGSTGGGMKTIRIIILFKSMKREMKRLIHPNAVGTVTFNGKTLGDETIASTHLFAVFYVAICVISMGIVALDGFDMVTTVTSVLATVNNIGPGLSLIGSNGNFSVFSPVSKIVMIMDMLVGRLEIFPMILIFVPSVWRKSAS